MGRVLIPTDAEIEAIRQVSDAENAREIRAVSVTYQRVGRLISLQLAKHGPMPGAIITFAADVSPALASATDEELSCLEVYPFGSTLALDAIGLHLSIEALVLSVLMGPNYHERLKARGAAAMGRSTSVAKLSAARENGKKGGRPRKRAIAESSANTITARAPKAK